MRKPVLIILVVILLFLAALTLFLKNRNRLPVLGPDITELQYSDVTFGNGDPALAGMLFLPPGKGPFPAVVMIHGSGASQRNDPGYLTVAGWLQQNGIAVLLPDKRGSEKSGGDWTKASFYDLAADSAAAMDFIRAQSVFPPACIGLMGVSEGGWVVPLAASGKTQAAFAVSMSGAAVTTDEQLLYEETNSIADFVGLRFLAERIAPLTAANVRQTDFWKRIAGFDPVPYWRAVDAPTFLAFGEGDKVIPVEESINRIQALGKQNITVRVYPAGGHGITDPATQRIQEAFLRDLTDFVRSVPGCQPVPGSRTSSVSPSF